MIRQLRNLGYRIQLPEPQTPESSHVIFNPFSVSIPTALGSKDADALLGCDLHARLQMRALRAVPWSCSSERRDWSERQLPTLS